MSKNSKALKTRQMTTLGFSAKFRGSVGLSFSRTRTIDELMTYGCGRTHVKPGF
jgi:hypothetical protein